MLLMTMVWHNMQLQKSASSGTKPGDVIAAAVDGTEKAYVNALLSLCNFLLGACLTGYEHS